jgi:uncharacterized protein (DUF2336 family)
MSAVFSLIPELEPVIANGSREKCADILQRITTLFVLGASTYNDLHVDLFDDLFELLIENIETDARAELSVRLASVTNAPVRVVRRLARDDDVAIAGPVLQLSWRLTEADLVDVANTKSRAHLLAIAARPGLSEAVASVLVRCGDPEVVQRVADNRSRHSSGLSLSHVAERAEGHSATPEVRAEIQELPRRLANQIGSGAVTRDYSAAQRVVLGLNSAGRLTEAALASFCRNGQYEEAVAAIATLAKVPINVADRVVGSDRPDPVLILCKAAGLSWPIVKAIFLMRPDRKGTSSEDFDRVFANYSGLSAATAQRVVRFWQARQHT